ncbi:hypothetical protein SAMN05661008_00526 [Alkalithermobacter thermoalcaliphilus JW-YL-7 = DSM 7308]|uniref:Flagellar Assembly Protein A N-terminal region domain-containing protein n=1 Tax=Alkalithermobacter thermoalcaliphilus JW-YL-7 = DSM 7308 TaxID=1121328 RepID=A0A150FQF0_CLOPD|nr:protein of unknown function DUF342 [[Clostridium] paradoxum JW-YL-7 = DSM 7308]SHK60190.1 hypothetical protein SAMN05661008_00526 [[Clostridium] paradoxum JW-YL-7 = DSM 7308]
MKSGGSNTIKENYGDFELVLSLFGNMMQAYLTIKTKCKDIQINKQQLIDFLKRNNVVYGVNEDLLETMISHRMYNSPVKIAQGLDPIKGEDGFIKYYFNINTKPTAKTLEDGTIDFKELGYVENIKKGTVLAEKFPPKNGIDGVNVLGETVKAPVGKYVDFKIGKNVQISEDGFKLISTEDGRIDFKDGKIEINTVLNIPSNVDAATGNIRFNGDIVINGDVKSNFLVQADGNIEINGVVEGAIIKSKGNLIVKGGIRGNEKANIYCGKDLTCKYIENAKVICEGDIVTDFILHSVISSGNNVTVSGKKGMIAGGSIQAKNEVLAKVIGSPMGTATSIEVGTDPKLKLKLDTYIQEKQNIQKNMEDLLQKINLFKKNMGNSFISEERKQILVKSLSLYKQLSENLELINKEIKAVEEKINNLNQGKVIVQDKIYSGSKIKIGIYVKYIYEDVGAAQFYIDNACITTKA